MSISERKHFDKNTRIAIFTSINRGGTMQLTTEIYKQLKSLGYTVNCIIPDRATFSPEDIQANEVHLFERKLLNNRINALFGEFIEYNNDVKNIANYLISNNFSAIITTDTSSFSLRVIKYLKSINSCVFTVATVHDAAPHPAYNASFKSKYYYWSSNLYRKGCLASADCLLFLSFNNMEKFKKTYPDLNDNLVCIPLGAHIPNVNALKPIEIDRISNGYYLFFGRLEKYKGLCGFLKAYNEYKDTKYDLVIAGNGVLTEEEQRLISTNERVLLIKRYISDEEMKWLFENSKASVLPYIEASQSGIIPISYSYSKPVITSNIQGLTQFVLNGLTGFICESSEDYVIAMKRIEDEKNYESMSFEARNYYDNNLDWSNNLREAINQFNNINKKS